MPELVPCDICGVIPTLQTSHSARLISHRCKDFHSGWGRRSEVVAQWNDSNPQNTKELGTTPNTGSPKLLALADRAISQIEMMSLHQALDTCKIELPTIKMFEFILPVTLGTRDTIKGINKYIKSWSIKFKKSSEKLTLITIKPNRPQKIVNYDLFEDVESENTEMNGKVKESNNAKQKQQIKISSVQKKRYRIVNYPLFDDEESIEPELVEEKRPKGPKLRVVCH